MALFTVGSKLIVSEQRNNRVLIWNSLPERTTTGNLISADVILGKADCTPDDGGTTKHTFNEPRGVWTDGRRLVVADTENNRVLIWNRFPTSPTDDADIVLGTGIAGSGQNQFSGPYAVVSDGTRLFVSDWHNNRVLLWGTFPSKTGELPTAVFGQPDFERSGVNSSKTDEQGAPSARTMFEPQGVYYSNNQLWVTDSGNNRILMFKLK